MATSICPICLLTFVRECQVKLQEGEKPERQKLCNHCVSKWTKGANHVTYPDDKQAQERS